MAPWPLLIYVGRMKLALDKRCIAWDPDPNPQHCEEPIDEEASQVVNCESLIGRAEGGEAISWQLRAISANPSASKPIAEEQRLEEYAKTHPIYLNRGTTYRSYIIAEDMKKEDADAGNPKESSPPAVKADEVEQQTAGLATEKAPPSPGCASRHARSRMSKAVAFEFVQGVMASVLGDDGLLV